MAGYVRNLLSRREIDAPNASGRNIALSRKQDRRCTYHNGRLRGNVCITYRPLNLSLVSVYMHDSLMIYIMNVKRR